MYYTKEIQQLWFIQKKDNEQVLIGPFNDEGDCALMVNLLNNGYFRVGVEEHGEESA